MTSQRLARAALSTIGGIWAATASAPYAGAATPPPPAEARPALAAAPAATPAATRPTTSPFDVDDPEIREIRRLDWRDADFEKLDLKTRGAALLALNQMLDTVGGKAEARAELLVDYVDTNNLGAAFTADAAAAEEPRHLTYDDAKKIAAAFIQSPQGRRQFGEEFARSSPAEQARYLELYDKTCRRKFEDAAEARAQVASMANFLDRQGKLDDFLAWAREETQRRQKAFEAELARKAEDRAQQDRERREQAVANAERRRQAEHELAMKRMEYNYQLERAAIENDRRRRYDDDGYGYGWGYGVYGPAAYYYNDAYRNALRGRIVTRYNTWNAGRVPTSARPIPGVWTRRR